MKCYIPTKSPTCLCRNGSTIQDTLDNYESNEDEEMVDEDEEDVVDDDANDLMLFHAGRDDYDESYRHKGVSLTL